MERKLTRRAFLLEAAGLAAAAVAAGCGATPTPGPTSTARVVEVTKVVEKPVTQVVEKIVQITPTPVPPTAVPPTPAPKVGGGIVMPYATDMPGMDACNPWGLSKVNTLTSLCYDPWYIYDKDYNLVPYVLKSVTRAAGSDTIVYEIKPGIKFHSGREFVAEDAVWGHERQIKADLRCFDATVEEGQIASFKAVDKYKFEVKLKDPKLLTHLVNLPPIIDKDTVAKQGKDGILLQAEGGTGPWMLKEWVSQSYISFKRNPDYWNKPPLLEEFKFVIMPEERAQVAAMKTGQINYMRISNIDLYEQLSADPGVNVFSSFTGDYNRLNVNHFRPAMKDINVLQAINHAMNRQQMIDTLTKGKGIWTGPVSLASKRACIPEAELISAVKYDPEMSKSLLAKSGYDEKNNRLKLVMLGISGYDDMNKFGLIAQSNLKAVGIDCELRIPEVGVWVDQRVKTKDYDLSVNGYSADLVDPDLSGWRSDRDEQGMTGGGDPELDKLIDQWLNEPDLEKRIVLAQSMQRLLLKNVREIFLFAAPSFLASSKKLANYTPWPSSPMSLRAFDWDQVYWKG